MLGVAVVVVGDHSNSYEQLNEYTFDSPSKRQCRGVCSRGLYGVISISLNLIIEKVANDTEVKKRAIAEAYFFRAWAKLRSLCYPLGTAPLVDHLLATDEYRLRKQSTFQRLFGLLWRQT